MKPFSAIISHLTGFGGGHTRTKRAKKHITASFISRGLIILLGLILVPLSISYLGNVRYGIWVTLSSIIVWFSFFDIGLDNGLRNKFAQALAKGQTELARTYVSTTYATLAIIITAVLLFFFLANPFINWNNILNADDSTVSAQELSMLALVVFIFFSLRFIFKLVATIVIADQRPAVASLFDLAGKLGVVLCVFILTRTTDGQLLYLGIAFSSIPVMVLLLASLILFRGRYKAFRPSFKYIDFSTAPALLSMGVKFFIIQITAILLYQTNNIIIAHIMGPAYVTPYHVAFKYFSVLLMAFTIIVAPFWSAFTEAWMKKEVIWIRKIMQKLIFIWIGLIVVAFTMWIFSAHIYAIWVGKEVVIPYKLSALVAVWVMLNAWSSIYSTFLNGVSKLRLQLTLGVIAAVINVPLAIFLGMKYGIYGILYANILVKLPGFFLLPLQSFKLINQKAHGFWNK